MKLYIIISINKKDVNISLRKILISNALQMSYCLFVQLIFSQKSTLRFLQDSSCLMLASNLSNATMQSAYQSEMPVQHSILTIIIIYKQTQQGNINIIPSFNFAINIFLLSYLIRFRYNSKQLIKIITMFRINESSPNFLKPERQHTPEKKQASTRSTIKLDLNQHGNFQNNQDEDQKRWPKSCRGKYRYLDQKINFQSSNTLTFRNYHKKQEDEKQQSQKLQTPNKQQIVKKFNLQQISPASNKSNNSYLKGISNKVQKDLKFRSVLSQYMSQKSNKSNCFNNFNNFKHQEQKLQNERQNSKVKQKQYKVLIQPFNLQKHQIQTQKKQITTKRQVSKPEFKLSNFLRTSRKNNEQKINLFKQFQESKRGQKQQNEIKKFKQIEENQTVFQQKQNEIKNEIQISPVFEENQKKSYLKNQQLKEQLIQKLLKANFQKIIEPLMIQISKLNAKVEELVQQKHRKQIQEKLINLEKKQINFNNQQIMQSHSHHQENIIFTNNKCNEQQQVQQSQIHISMSSQPDIKISCQKQKYEQFAFLQAKQIRHTDSFRVEANNFQEELNNLQNSATHKSQINYLLDESSEEEFYYQV